jgi:hypothetical protein
MESIEQSIRIFGAVGSTTRRVEWTVKEYARIERVSERTVWTWIAKGAVPTRRTPGGRIRIMAR